MKKNGKLYLCKKKVYLKSAFRIARNRRSKIEFKTEDNSYRYKSEWMARSGRSKIEFKTEHNSYRYKGRTEDCKRAGRKPARQID